MNKAYRDYELNGWIIRSSEYYNDWDLTPIFNNSELTEIFRGEEEVRFNRLVEAKKWVKTEEAEQLKNKYKNLAVDTEYYLNAYKELGEMLSSRSRDFTKQKQLIDICIEGQEKGIKELQKMD